MAKEDTAQTPLTVGSVRFAPSEGTQSKSVLRRLTHQKRGAEADAMSAMKAIRTRSDYVSILDPVAHAHLEAIKQIASAFIEKHKAV